MVYQYFASNLENTMSRTTKMFMKISSLKIHVAISTSFSRFMLCFFCLATGVMFLFPLSILFLFHFDFLCFIENNMYHFPPVFFHLQHYDVHNPLFVYNEIK